MEAPQLVPKSRRRFLSAAEFCPPSGTYSLLPFRFHRLAGKEVLVNECGEYLVADTGTTQAIVKRRLDPTSVLYADLCAKHFISDDAHPANFDLVATKCRTKREFMFGSTRLHIFVVTLRCDHSCLYCQVSRQTANRQQFDMSEETARRALRVVFESPAPILTLELQGGEPTLAMDRVEQIVSDAKRLATANSRQLSIVLTTNLAHLSDDLLTYIRQEGVKVSTSLDGPRKLHNANRPRPGGDSFELATEGIRRCREELGQGMVSALMTTTQASLEHPAEIVDEYVRQGLHAIFLRPISPYGFAVRTKSRTGYEPNRFLNFYRCGLERILEINERGYPLVEVYAKLLLTKMLTPFGTGYVDLQSPSGAAFGALVYNYTGDVFVSDEGRMLAEMGDFGMRIGNVHTHSRRELLRGEAFTSMVEAWCNESLPGCADCAFQSYCGSDPTFHYATQRDVIGHRPTSDFCARNMGLIEYLLGLLESGNQSLVRTLWSWVNEDSAGSICNPESSPE